MSSTDLIVLTVVLTLINSVMLGLNIAIIFEINNTADRIELGMLKFILKGDKENNDQN